MPGFLKLRHEAADFPGGFLLHLRGDACVKNRVVSRGKNY